MNLTDRREQRLQSYKKIQSEQEIYECVLAPTLYEFVVWVLQEALQSGTKRLYFLARDGYQMYLAARKLCKQYDLDIECRYLKVSRYAVRVPEYHLLGERCLERICVGGIDVTFEKIMQRAALTDKEAGEIAALAGYTENYRKVINYHEVMQLKDRLKKIPLLFHYIDSHSKEAYGTAIGYLTQEGLLEQIPYALVDSGWIGTIQQSIEHLLRQRQPDRKLEGYYFGLYEIPEGEGRENYHSFYFTPWGEIKRNSGRERQNHLCSGDRQQGEPEPGTDQPVYLLAGRVSAGEKAIIAAGGQRVCGGNSITVYGKPDTV